MKTISLFLFVLISPLIMAQKVDSLDLGEFVITASKMSTLEKETTKPVTIIDQELIRRSAGKNIPELLNEQNGVQINGSLSNPGKDKSVFLRGADTEYTLILIDGFPVTDPSSEGGAFDLRLIPLNNVERIEIVKGSMSTLYGSDAIAGVINIITKKSEESALNGNFEASYGSFQTTGFSAGVNGTHKSVSYALNASRDQTEGISEAEPQGNTESKRDGFLRNAVGGRINVTPVKNFTFTPFLNYSRYDGDYDEGAFLDADNRYEAAMLNSGFRTAYENENLDVRGAYTSTSTERKFTDDFGVFNPKAQLQNVDIFGSSSYFSHAKFIAGLNYQNLSFQLDDAGIDRGSQLYSPYVTTYLKSAFGLNAELGFRLNYHSEYGTNWTYNIAPVYQLTNEFRLMSSYSSGFKAPTLNELFGPFGANPELQPQISRTLDIGAEFKSDGLKLASHYFNRSIKDLIIYNYQSGYININEQYDWGLEITASYETASTEMEFFYNYLEGVIREDGVERDNLIRKPNHSFGVKISQTILRNLNVDLFTNYHGKRADVYFNSMTGTMEEVALKEYVLINLHSQYEIPKHSLSFFMDLKNVMNTHYTEVYGFNTPGTHFKIGLQYRF